MNLFVVSSCARANGAVTRKRTIELRTWGVFESADDIRKEGWYLVMEPDFRRYITPYWKESLCSFLKETKYGPRNHPWRGWKRLG